MSSIQRKIAELSTIEKYILKAFERLIEDKKKANVDYLFSEDEIFEASGLASKEQLRSGLNFLVSRGIVKVREKVVKVYSLGKEGQLIAEKGLPEKRAIGAIKNSNKEVVELNWLLENDILAKNEIPIAIGWLKRKKLVEIFKKEGKTYLNITEVGKKIRDEIWPEEKIILSLKEKEKKESEFSEKEISMLLELKRRKNIVKEKERIFREYGLSTLGSEILKKGFELKTLVTRLTPDLIRKGEFEKIEFQAYDVRMYVPARSVARLHPVREVINEIREIFTQMGFSEIHGEVVVPAFWNMDALFIPQDHPARDMQDTFYLSTPAKISLKMEKEKGWFKKVKEVHQDGGTTGSKGWRHPFNEEECVKTLLRTHTTVNTIRYLADHPEPPQKIFSIGRVFRKEAIDSTHLPEFHQIEGIVLEENANFNMLIGILKDFYSQMDFKELRFRPAYFPYTEPSLEVEVKFEDKWLELGGAGIFRPEVGEPFGIKYPILAWGLGLERLVMLRLGLKDIRELYISDIDWLR